MVKKVLIVILVLSCTVFVVSASYVGSLMRAEDEIPLEAIPVAKDVYEAVSLYNLYGAVQLERPDAPTATGVSDAGPSQSDATPESPSQELTLPPLTEEVSATQPEQPTSAADGQQDAFTLEYTIAQMEKAAGYLKNAKNFKAVKKQTGNAEILALSIGWLRAPGEMIINRIIESIKPLPYEFKDGYAVDPRTKETVTPFDVLPPAGYDFSIDPAGVTKYNVTPHADGSVTYSVWICEETSDLYEFPKYHSTCMGYLKLEQFDLGGVKITSGTVIYHEGQLDITVDANGVPISLRGYLPMTGTGAGELGISATASLTGYLEDVWEFTW